jgi:hypothetical protein
VGGGVLLCEPLPRPGCGVAPGQCEVCPGRLRALPWLAEPRARSKQLRSGRVVGASALWCVRGALCGRRVLSAPPLLHCRMRPCASFSRARARACFFFDKAFWCCSLLWESESRLQRARPDLCV